MASRSPTTNSCLQVVDQDNEENPPYLFFDLVQTTQTEHFYMDSKDGSIFSSAEMNAFQNNIYEMEIKVIDQSLSSFTDTSIVQVLY